MSPTKRTHDERRHGYRGEKPVKIAVIKLPRMSNFTDFSVFEQFTQVSVYYTETPEGVQNADMIILPGTKSTMSDLLWLRQSKNGRVSKLCHPHIDNIVFL